MSKYLSILNCGSGKLGDIVLQRNNVQRKRKYEIKNPNSIGQAYSRMIAATATRSYSAMKGIVDHSFAGIPYGGKSMNYFIKEAMRLTREKIIAAKGGDVDALASATPKFKSGIVPQEWLISKGNLPTIITAYSKTSGDTQSPFFKVPGTFSPASMAQYGLRAGDQLTFVAITCDNNPRFIYSRVILKADADMTAVAFTPDMFETESDSQIVSVLVNNSANSEFNCSSVFRMNLNQVFTAVITSRLVDGNWQRSTEHLTWVGDQDAADFDEFGYTVAFPTWLSGGTSLAESDRYLNEG